MASARERLLELDLTAPMLEPAPMVWERIAERLPRTPVHLDGTERPAAPVRGRRPTVARGWRRAAIASMAASLLLAIGLGWTVWTGAPTQLVAILVDDQGEPLVIVEVLPANAVRVTPIGDLRLPAGRALELWTLPSAAAGPVSLGVLQEAASRTLVGPTLPPTRPDQLFEISVEDPGGSPVGRPTGPVLVKGLAREPR